MVETVTGIITILALAPEEISAWQIALGIGGVVLVAVILLLGLLLRFVNQIDRGVQILWDTATRFAANTATLWQIDAVAYTLEELRDEVRHHDELLGQR
ncbi:MAG: hypothetical protein M3198_09910 [Actinomycetota bacterium]|nr:hypothetical protein [Actinomycetota bacterium]